VIHRTCLGIIFVNKERVRANSVDDYFVAEGAWSQRWEGRAAEVGEEIAILICAFLPTFVSRGVLFKV
jgi:hypothetical protein